MKPTPRFTTTLIRLALLGTLGLAACGGGGGGGGDEIPVDPTPVDPTPVDPTPVDPPPVDPTPTPIEAGPAPAKVWIGYSAEPGQGTQMYDAATGLWTAAGNDNCADKPVAMDIYAGGDVETPIGDGVTLKIKQNALMGMSAGRKLMAIDTVTGTCHQIPLGALETAMNNQAVKGFAVNATGVHAVLLDDGAMGRVVTFKLGDAALASDTTLWTTPYAAPLDTTATAYAIDFKMMDYSTMTPPEAEAAERNKLIVVAHTASVEMSHILTYDGTTGALTGGTAGAMQNGTATNVHQGDIVVNGLPAAAGDRIYARTGWGPVTPGSIEAFNYVSSMPNFLLEPYRFNGVTTSGAKQLVLNGDLNLTGALAAR